MQAPDALNSRVPVASNKEIVEIALLPTAVHSFKPSVLLVPSLQCTDLSRTIDIFLYIQLRLFVLQSYDGCYLSRIRSPNNVFIVLQHGFGLVNSPVELITVKSYCSFKNRSFQRISFPFQALY